MPNITKRYRIRPSANGPVKQLRWVINYVDPLTSKRAQRFYPTKAAAQAALERLLGPEQAIPTRRVTVAEAIRRWLDAASLTAGDRALADYRYYSGIILKDPVAFRDVTSLTTADIIEFIKRVQRPEYTKRRALKYLKSALINISRTNNIRCVQFPRLAPIRRSGPKTVPAEVVGKVLGWATTGDRNAALVALAFTTGLRPGELLGLTWADVEGSALHVRRTQDRQGKLLPRPKTDSSVRSVPVSPSLLQAVRVEGAERVLSNVQGRGLKYPNFRTNVWTPVLRRAMAECGVPREGAEDKNPAGNYGPHCARRFYSSWLQAAGVPLATVAEAMGHKSSAITLQRYTVNVSGSRLIEEALNKMCSA